MECLPQFVSTWKSKACIVEYLEEIAKESQIVKLHCNVLKANVERYVGGLQGAIRIDYEADKTLGDDSN